jgi:hypothetical protein
MLTAPALPKSAGHRLLTSEEFLEWLQPGVRETFMPDLDQTRLAQPRGKVLAVSGCVAEILASRRPTSRKPRL